MSRVRHPRRRRPEQLGYTDVADYTLGKQDWIEAGLPTETGSVRVHS
ncbi:MAG: hypothetical protein M3425_04500 [Actinomycetota bacterium]|nr:hypothetical protein [Actinomycetota bacterium]